MKRIGVLIIIMAVVCGAWGKEQKYKRQRVQIPQEIQQQMRDQMISTGGPTKGSKKYKKDDIIVTGHEQSQYLSLGVRGGAGLTYGATEGVKFGFDLNGMLDVHYEVYRHAKKSRLGFLTGVTAEFQQMDFQQKNWQHLYSTPTDGGKINYTISADNVTELRRRVSVEVPLMFSLITDKDFFFRVGPRLAFPVWEQGVVKFANPNVNAYFAKEDVDVLNELITGKISTLQPSDIQLHAPFLSIKASVELGGEIRLKHGDLLCLGMYVDWTAYSVYRSTYVSHLIEIIPPSNTVQPAQIIFNAPSDQYARGLGHVHAGIKLAYQFNLLKPKKK